MTANDPLDAPLRALSGLSSGPVQDGFLDGVWQRAGELQAQQDGRQRLGLFAGLFVVGLAAGAGVPQTAALASERPAVSLSGDALAPASLLQVTR